MRAMPSARRVRSKRVTAAAPDPMAGHEWIATAHIPQGEEMRLMRHGSEFTILLRDTELMSTRASASEAALATLTAARIGPRPAPQWLIGGYGLGFTLRAALAVLPSDAGIVVAEIAPEIIAWALGPMHALTAGCLDDPRVTVVDNDVGLLIETAHDAYDAILLDVDNGPEGLTRLHNDALYDTRGIDAAFRALRSGGILAIWSAFEDPAFTARLVTAGFIVEDLYVREEHDANERYTIWFARKA